LRPLQKGEVLADRTIVLAKVEGRFVLHFVGAQRPNQFRVENAYGKVTGWCSRKDICGVVIKA
jgi:hypothetical protein